jgi:hypothetical protein
MPKDYYECTEREKKLISRGKSLLWRIMLPVIGMTGFAIALGFLGLFLTPDCNGSYTALSLSDRVRIAVKKVTPTAQPSGS